MSKEPQTTSLMGAATVDNEETRVSAGVDPGQRPPQATQTKQKALKLAQIYSLPSGGYQWRITWWDGDKEGDGMSGEEEKADDCAMIVRHLIQENDDV